MKQRLKFSRNLLKQTFTEFSEDRPLDWAANIGFYTIFSLPAILIIMIRIAGAAFGREAVKGEVVRQFGSIVGRSSAEQIQNIIESASTSSAGTITTILGIATLLFASTTVFVSLQDSINAMWEVRAKPEKGWLKFVTNRLLSLALVVSLGFLLLVSLTIEVFLGILHNYLENQFTDIAIYFITAGNILFSILIATLIFAAIFKVLPDAKIQWKNVWIGAAVTAILFVIGKYLLNFYLQHDPLADSYGAAASLVLILVWVYYTSIIFLFGAEFTQVYSRLKDRGIEPAENAVRVKTKEIEKDEN